MAEHTKTYQETNPPNSPSVAIQPPKKLKIKAQIPAEEQTKLLLTWNQKTPEHIKVDKSKNKARAVNWLTAVTNCTAEQPHKSFINKGNLVPVEDTVDDNLEDMDQSLSPGPFYGRNNEDPEEWIEAMGHWLTYKGLTGEKAMSAIALFLRGGAHEWFGALSDQERRDLDEFTTLFRQRYLKPELNRWRDSTRLFDLKQEIGQSAEDFITLAIKQSKKTEVPTETLQQIIIKGLRPEIRSHLIDKTIKNIDDIVKYSQMAEAKELAAGKSSGIDLTEVMKAIKEMRGELSDLKPRHAHVSTPTSSRPTTPKPRVTFEDEAEADHANQYTNFSQTMQPMAGNGQRNIQTIPEWPQQPQQWNQSNFSGQSGSPVGGNQGGWRGRGRGSWRGSGTRYGNAPVATYGGAQDRQQQPSGMGCSNCGSNTCSGRAECRAKGKTCMGCGKIGHFRIVCRSASQQGAAPRQ